MAENDESSLIGYDPLAWMQQTDENRAEPAVESDDTAAGLVDTLAIIPEAETGDFQLPLSETESDMPVANNKAVLVLDSVLNIQNVSGLHQQLMQMLNSHNAIDIDASAVTMIDTSSLQLLLILKQTAVRLEKAISIDFPSDRFIEAAELLGVAEMLEVDQAASGFF